MRISDWSSDVCSSDLFLLDLLVDGCNRFAHLLHAFGRCHIHLHAMLLKGGKCFVGFLARILALVIAAGCGGLHQYVFFSRAQAVPPLFAGRADPRALYVIGHVQVFLHRSEEHTSELQSLMRSSYAVVGLKKHNSTALHKTPLHYRQLRATLYISQL